MRVFLVTAALVAIAAAPAPETPKEGEKKKWDVNAPPGEAASVAIDTRTGTWMSVDVSPDGKTLAFDLLGDVYTMPIEGGEAKALTHSIAWEMQPRFSPDGKRLAFMSDQGGGDNAWVMDADGTNPKAVTAETFRLVNNPTWHPNGEYIAVRKLFTGTRSLGSGEIWLYHASGTGKGVQLNEKPNWQKDLGEPAFSPDGRYVYFSQDTTAGRVFQYNKNSNTQIYVIQRLDTKDGSIEPFVTGSGGAIRPVPSPDGKTLAFVRRVRMKSTLFLKDLQSGEERPLWDGLERDLQEAWAVHGVYPSFDWTPDSKEIVVWAQGKLWRVPAATGTPREIPFHVKDSRDVRKAPRFETPVSPDTFDVRQLRWVAVSPAGDKVVYSALGHLYLRDLPTGTPKRVTTSADRFEFFPSFSRDGQRLAFVTWNDESLGSVRTLDLKTGREVTLTKDPGKYLSPRFSPDGKIVVYQRSRGGFLTSPWHGLHTGVYRIAADGSGAPVRITADGAAPQFGAQNDRVYVSRSDVQNEVDLSSTLVSMNLDGGEERVTAKSEKATEFALSPDGKWIAFVDGFQVYVTPLAPFGKKQDVGPSAEALPVTKVSANAGESLHWSGDSRKVRFVLGDQLFERSLQDAFAFVDGAPKELPKPSEDGTRIGFGEKTAKPAATIALAGARIVTMRGDEVIPDGTVVVTGSRITAVGPTASVTIPAGATRLDVKGKTIVPGMIDAHWHGGMGEDGFIPQQSWVDLASLAFGVTTVHDPSNDTGEIFTHAEMQKAGLVVAPRIFSTGATLSGAKSPNTAKVDSLDDALTHLKRMKAAGAISVKSYNQPRREQRQQILEAARQSRMMVVPEGGSLFQMNMNMIVDGHTGIEHAIPIAHLYDDVRQLWAGTNVGYTPTLVVAFGGLDGEHYFYATTDVWKHPILTKYVPRTILDSRSIRRETAPKGDFNVIDVAKTATMLQRAGVPVNTGAHGQREGLGTHWELWMLVEGGMTPLEALRSATLNPAKYLGFDNELGSLEVGKLADLSVIDGDLLTDIRLSDRVTHVMVNGRLYDTSTMDEVGATPKKRPKLFFERTPGGYVPADTETLPGACNH
jgi:imidazolonepropionase-like amidohydrolase/Tol biopolymer transport system component